VRRSFNKLGKAATLFAATSLLMATTSVIPADAANKAGARCTKANAKTKIGGDQYLCTKNPTVKKARLTWVWIGCVESHKLYLDANSRLKAINESAAKALTMLDTEIAAIKAEAQLLPEGITPTLRLNGARLQIVMDLLLRTSNDQQLACATKLMKCQRKKSKS